MSPDERIGGPLGPYNSEALLIDGNTGTQLDVPPHSVTPPDSGLPNAGPFGRSFTDVIPAWQFGGEACVIDCTDLIDAGGPRAGAPLVTKGPRGSPGRRHTGRLVPWRPSSCSCSGFQR